MKENEEAAVMAAGVTRLVVVIIIGEETMTPICQHHNLIEEPEDEAEVEEIEAQ